MAVRCIALPGMMGERGQGGVRRLAACAIMLGSAVTAVPARIHTSAAGLSSDKVADHDQRRPSD